MAVVRTPGEIGALIRAVRTARKWTQLHAAEDAGVSRQFVAQVEAGHPNAELWRVLKLLEVLDVSLDATPRSPRQSAHAHGVSTVTATMSIAATPHPDDLDLSAHLEQFDRPTP